MIRQLKERFWLYADGKFSKTREIRVYPDASGDSRKSMNASETDIALLKQAGFIVSEPAANPPVKDRINSMNAMFCNATGVVSASAKKRVESIKGKSSPATSGKKSGQDKKAAPKSNA